LGHNRAVGFGELAVVCAIGILGPLLALPKGWDLPVALGELVAATIGAQLGVLRPGEGSALMLGALVSIGIAVVGGVLAVRRGMVAPVGTGSC